MFQQKELSEMEMANKNPKIAIIILVFFDFQGGYRIWDNITRLVLF